MQDLRNLYNQALSAIGAEASVTDPAATTKATNILNLWYPVARHSVMTAVHWPSLRVASRLSRIKERDESQPWANTDPAPGYHYAFNFPTNMLLPQYLEDFSRFRLGRLGTQPCLFTNTETPVLAYTVDESNPALWEPDLYRCVLWALASNINMARSGKMGVTQKLEQQTYDLIQLASVNLANADDTYYDTTPSFYADTGFSTPNMHARFYYPTVSYRAGNVTA